MKEIEKKTQAPIRIVVDIPKATLKFSPYAWAKLNYLRDLGTTEVGGFAISSMEDPLSITDICLVKQTCSSASIKFDDEDVANFFEDCVDEGLHPQEFGRIWVHTHPGSLITPSSTDEETFQKTWGNCNWAVMFILAQSGACSAHLQYLQPKHRVKIDVEIDYTKEFSGSNRAAWQDEYKKYVTQEVFTVFPKEYFKKNSVEKKDGLSKSKVEEDWWEDDYYGYGQTMSPDWMDELYGS